METKHDSSCPECGGDIRRDRTERICLDCGLITGVTNVDVGPEWRSFEEDEGDPRRTGAPLTRSRHDRGLSTRIGHGGDVRITGRKRRQFARLRTQHQRAQCRSKAERNQRDVFMQIHRLTASLSLPASTRERACMLFRSAQNEGLIRGRSLEGFTAATVYAACRLGGYPRTTAEILTGSRATEDELRAAYDALNRELGLPVGPIDPVVYVPRFGTRLDLPVAVRLRAETLVRNARRVGMIGGRNPCGVAAACLYAAAREHEAGLTQKEAATVGDVSTVTIRSTVDALRERRLTSA
ncbi:transcription initiation factor IIB [Halalkalicoccus salilacus]|uniref:transcription initiation factor IIB n=1 Tax=Halalkalicoccus salilacus TaxID=3117459 RepID=UPI00300EDF77